LSKQCISGILKYSIDFYKIEQEIGNFIIGTMCDCMFGVISLWESKKVVMFLLSTLHCNYISHVCLQKFRSKKFISKTYAQKKTIEIAKKLDTLMLDSYKIIKEIQ